MFRLYPGGVTGDDLDIVRKMRLGTLDAGLLTVGGLSHIDRGILALELPLAYADYGELDCVRINRSPVGTANGGKGVHCPRMAGWRMDTFFYQVSRKHARRSEKT